MYKRQGFELKEKIKKILESLDLAWEDLGTNSEDSCDYPDYARAVAEAVSKGKSNRGIICCGSGIGVSIVACLLYTSLFHSHFFVFFKVGKCLIFSPQVPQCVGQI